MGGCIFCSERGSGEHIKNTQNITKQVQHYLKSYKAMRANKFIAYFQNFTNTYDTLENLKAKYDSALMDDRIVALAIASRPDCINEKIVKLIKSYCDKYYVWVELGLQTSKDETGLLLNRGYSSKQFSEAVHLLNTYGIDVVTHIMVGLPNENFEDLKNTVNFVNRHKLQGIKIHSTYVVKNTKLARMYENGSYVPISLENYMECLIYVLTHIHPDFVIHRIVGDAPKDLLVAPEWNLHKKLVLNGVEKMMKESNLWQGMYYKN